MTDADVIVIGSGAGGMTAALCLARAGLRVSVVERHYVPGGWCHSFELDGHRFSPGVHYVGELREGGRLRRILRGLGVAPHLTFFEMNRDGYDHILSANERFDIPAGRPRFAARLRKRFPDDAAGIERYFELMERMAAELNAGIDAQMGLREPGARRPETLARHGLTPIGELVDALVNDPFLRTILLMQCGNHGVAPARAPAASHAAVVAHFLDGGSYPAGGAFTIPRAFLRELRGAGGRLRVRAPVARILLDSGGGGGRRRAIGVRLADGEELRARHVVSNADPETTFLRLVGRDALGRALLRRLERTRYSVSALSLFMATRADLRGLGLDSGNFWYSRTADLQRWFDAAERPADAADPIEALFLTATTLKDPTKMHDGCHTLEAFSFTSWDRFAAWAGSETEKRPPGYDALKRELTRRMLDGVEAVAPGVTDRLVLRELGTPLTNEHYVGTTRGCIYGTEKSREQIGPFAFGVRTEIDRLTLCGASATAQGVFGGIVSGLAAARNVLGCPLRDLLTHDGGDLRLLPAEDRA